MRSHRSRSVIAKLGLASILNYMPRATVEKEYERRIAATNAVFTICDAEGAPPSRPRRALKCSADDVDMSPVDFCLS